MRVIELQVRIHPDVQIEKHEIIRAARADVMAADHLGNRLHHLEDLLLGDHEAVRQDAGGGVEDVPAGVGDEHRHHQRRERIEPRIAGLDADQRGDHRDGGEQVAGGMRGVGVEHLALQPASGTPLVEHHPEVDREGADHHHEGQRADGRRAAGLQPLPGRRQHLAQHQQQENHDAERGHRLEFAMPVGMVVVGRGAGDAHADDADDVRGGVGEGVVAVGQHRHRAGRQAERDLRGGDD